MENITKSLSIVEFAAYLNRNFGLDNPNMDPLDEGVKFKSFASLRTTLIRQISYIIPNPEKATTGKIVLTPNEILFLLGSTKFQTFLIKYVDDANKLAKSIPELAKLHDEYVAEQARAIERRKAEDVYVQQLAELVSDIEDRWGWIDDAADHNSRELTKELTNIVTHISPERIKEETSSWPNDELHEAILDVLIY